MVIDLFSFLKPKGSVGYICTTKFKCSCLCVCVCVCVCGWVCVRARHFSSETSRLIFKKLAVKTVRTEIALTPQT